MVAVHGVFLACSHCAGDYENPDWTAWEAEGDGLGTGWAVDPDEYEAEWPDEPDGDAGQASLESNEGGDEFPV